MARPYRIFLVRHLKTIANEQRVYCGWTDSGLVSLEGEAIELPVAVQQVIGSDLIRTRQTATIYFPQAEFAADLRWRECHFGDFEEQTYDQLKNDPDYRNWLDDSWNIPPRNGETLQQVKSRVLDALAELPNEAVVVTHGGVIRVVLDTFTQNHRSFWEWNVTNGSIWQLEWASEKEFKEGKPCTSLSEVPITAKRIM
ncbi:histidine phosphatase family protein [Sporosarcina sp. P16a]|uniref:histidine phosphatase family protein n=1 Tax=unclassified Sporosarcina TaxID=2647733 RepID=UPI000C16FD28|nr:MULTISPECIES: histidine phosphatase family protein [unclassified Sporosarcina]PIC66795.1 histidine phosphatase family protein [Sporosarcina sp. P16a]PIC94205.1 histidine phosphatase family protein [Sporosarcina sp. P25]